MTASPPTPQQSSALTTIAAILSSPSPFIDDLPALFAAFSALYFRSLVHPSTKLLWSTRMTSCAGVCYLDLTPAKRPVDPRACTIRLSSPLLQYRPRSDILNTLLHESIHAYLFLAGGKHVRGDDPSGHGSGFRRLAEAINIHGGYEISTVHAFHAEVIAHQTHVWQCTGSCRELSPYYGIVRRAMNRPPGPNDSWYGEHAERCKGGEWVKISEPVKKDKKAGGQKSKIDGWLVKGTEKGKRGLPVDSYEGGGEKRRKGSEMEKFDLPENDKTVPDNDYSANKTNLSTCGISDTGSNTVIEPPELSPSKPSNISFPPLVDCPVCPVQLPESEINTHLDDIHGF